MKVISAATCENCHRDYATAPTVCNECGSDNISSRTHEHDCENCIYLSSVYHDGLQYDLYLHPLPHFTLIARYSSDGPDYISGAPLWKSNALLGKAADIAIKNKLITLDQLEAAQ